MDIISFNEAATANGRIESFIENPDSTSGIVTVPKVIASGENITIPAGRVAVLPDVQVEGTLNIEGDVFIPSGATFGDLENQISLKADTSYVNGKYSGFKNYIINGNFDIWQRGTSQTCTSAAFQYGSVDRFCLVNTEATNYTISRVSIDGTEPFSANYFVRNVVPLNTTSGIVFDQHIENLKRFSNKTVTLSMWVKGDAGKKIGLGCQAQYGTGGTPSDPESILGKVFILTGSWQKVVMTATLHDVITGKTYGTNGNSYLRIFIAFSSGSTSSVPEIFFQSGTFDIAQIQLEEGSVATPFEQRPIGLELSLCQRYARPIPVLWDIVQSSMYAYGQFRYSFPPMRVAPTLTSAGYFVAGGGANGTPLVVTEETHIHIRNSSNNWTVGNGIQYYEGFLSAEL